MQAHAAAISSVHFCRDDGELVVVGVECNTLLLLFPLPLSSICTPVLFECACCGDEVAGRPMASCSSCSGRICLSCLGRHIASRGIFKTHTITKSSPGSEELLALHLGPSAQFCVAHPFEALVLACSTSVSDADGRSHSRLICAHCVPEHSGHCITPIARIALESRGRVAQMLFDFPAPAAEAASICGPAQLDPSESLADLESKSVQTARKIARSAATRLSAVPEFADAAMSHVSRVRDALIGAITERATQLTEEIKSAAAAKEAAIGDELAAADTELARVSSESGVLARALGADGLSDVDIIVHAESLVSVVRVSERAVAALEMRPQTNPLLEMRPVDVGPTARSGLQAYAEAAAKAFGELHVAK